MDEQVKSALRTLRKNDTTRFWRAQAKGLVILAIGYFAIVGILTTIGINL